MQLEILIALIVVLSLASLLIAILLYLTLRKIIGNRHRRRLEAATAVMRTPVFEWLLYGKVTRHLRLDQSPAAYEAAEKLLDQYAQVLSGDEGEARIREFADKQFTARYRKRLSAPGEGLRLVTLRRMDRFAMRHMASDLLGLLEHPRKYRKMTTEEIVLTYKILAGWDSPVLLPKLQQSRLTISLYQQRLIVASMSESTLSRMLADREAYPDPWILATIDVIGIKRLEDKIDELLSLLQHPESEYRIRTLKALSELSLVPSDSRFLKHAESLLWQERNMAAKLFGKLRDPIYADALLGLLSDSSWFVRSQAAQSIKQYPGGQAVLDHAAEHAADQYARDMAVEWKERGRSNA
jgi:hypothetical protein